MGTIRTYITIFLSDFIDFFDLAKLWIHRETNAGWELTNQLKRQNGAKEESSSLISRVPSRNKNKLTKTIESKEKYYFSPEFCTSNDTGKYAECFWENHPEKARRKQFCLFCWRPAPGRFPKAIVLSNYKNPTELCNLIRSNFLSRLHKLLVWISFRGTEDRLKLSINC